MAHPQKLWQVLVDFAADGARAVLPLLAGLPHRHHVVRIHLMERDVDLLGYLSAHGTRLQQANRRALPHGGKAAKKWFLIQLPIVHTHLHRHCTAAAQRCLPFRTDASSNSVDRRGKDDWNKCSLALAPRACRTSLRHCLPRRRTVRGQQRRPILRTKPKSNTVDCHKQDVESICSPTQGVSAAPPCATAAPAAAPHSP